VEDQIQEEETDGETRTRGKKETEYLKERPSGRPRSIWKDIISSNDKKQAVYCEQTTGTAVPIADGKLPEQQENYQRLKNDDTSRIFFTHFTVVFIRKQICFYLQFESAIIIYIL
jgi:hypothetical protein